MILILRLIELNDSLEREDRLDSELRLETLDSELKELFVIDMLRLSEESEESEDWLD